MQAEAADHFPIQLEEQLPVLYYFSLGSRLAQTSTDNSLFVLNECTFQVSKKAFYPSVTDIKPTFYLQSV